jgi:transglutaminase-like putative cysteine protease
MTTRTSLPLLLLLLPAACRAAETRPEIDRSRPSRTFGFVYQAAVEELPEGAREVRTWVPIPVDTLDQTIDNVRVTGLSGNTAFELPPALLEQVEADGEKGGVRWSVHDLRSGTGRTLCLTTAGPVELQLTFDVTRYETEGGGKPSKAELADALASDTLIPLDGKVSKTALELPSEQDPLGTGHDLYVHVLERMKYDKPDGQPWGRGDAEWACDSRYGNCTDFHSYFMGLARTKGIPARFEIGFSVPGGDEAEKEVSGYHCWAFFWSGDRWVPVDISEADKHPEKADYFFGTLDYDRVTMTEGRDLELEPAPAAGRLNFLVHPYVEVDGKPWAKVTKSFKRLRR